VSKEKKWRFKSWKIEFVLLARKSKSKVVALEFGYNKSKLKNIREEFCNGNYIVLIK